MPESITSQDREKVAVDLDDFLADHVEAFVEFSNSNYGTNLSVETHSENWEELWGVDRDEVERRAAEFHTPETVSAFKPKLIGEDKEKLKILSTHKDLYVVTSRKSQLEVVTNNWIDENYHGLFKGVHLVPSWETNQRVTKALVCRQIGAEYLIDDMAFHCNLAALGGIKAILYGDFAWNRNEDLAKGVTRCRDMSEVLAYFGIGADNITD